MRDNRTGPALDPTMANSASRSTAMRVSLTLAELLDRSVWFPGLSTAGRALVREAMREAPLPMGAVLVHRHEKPRDWCGVLEGLLKLSALGADGRPVTYGGLGVGSWCLEATLVREKTLDADLVALRPSRVALMPKAVFDELRRSEPAFAEFLLHQISERLHWFMGNYLADRLLTADALVVRALVGLFHTWLHPLGERHLQISQEEIAHLAGVSRQSCNRALRWLSEDELVRIEYGGVTILDLDGLRRLLG